jgi:hypothetical protein
MKTVRTGNTIQITMMAGSRKRILVNGITIVETGGMLEKTKGAKKSYQTIANHIPLIVQFNGTLQVITLAQIPINLAIRFPALQPQLQVILHII